MNVPRQDGKRFQRRLRVAWAVVTLLVVETVVLAVAALPAVAIWNWGADWERVPEWGRVLFLAAIAVPSYLVFALGVLFYSAMATRLLGWRTQPDLEARLADFEWPLLDWGRYLVSIHVARMFAGAVFRSTPVWVQYMRWNGATIGRGVWVNSLALMDHNLLEFGDRVVIGSDARVSGHTVERGLLKTAPVRIGAGSTIGIGTVVGIGVRIGEGTQVGSLSVVPKFTELAAHATYAGAPVRRLERSEASE
jgi:acetyltransferase-like isoleucine patch superfamily enzyme